MPLDELGFEVIDNFISKKIADSILDEIEAKLSAHKGGGIRNADKKFSSISALACSELILSKAINYLKEKPNLVRAILFDKNKENNWLATWHQDKTIALSCL